jgi:anti-sigma regulatory factor (Ser/Thr protein kinase)
LSDKFNSGYVCRNFLGYAKRTGSKQTIEDIINSKRRVFLSTVINFYKKMKEKENPDANIFNWVDEAEQCAYPYGKMVDKNQVKTYLKSRIIKKERICIRARGKGLEQVARVIMKYIKKSGNLHSAGIGLGYSHRGSHNAGHQLKEWASGDKTIPLSRFEKLCYQLNENPKKVLTHDEITLEDSYSHEIILLENLYDN